MFNIDFNNNNSFGDFGLAIEHRPIIPVPKRRINQIVVPGRNGSLTEDEGTYEDMEIPVNFAFVNKENVYEQSRTIVNWLNGTISDNHLIFSDDPDYYYKVKFVRTSDIERFMIIVGKFTATFVCEPFKYSVYDDSTVITTPCTLYNTGTVFSEPVIKVYGSGNIALTINGRSFSVSGINQYVTIDSVFQDSYKDTILYNNNMTGEFPIFDIGDNSISWTGNITKIEITPNWRWI
jgi:predicted phage tail component-like protein